MCEAANAAVVEKFYRLIEENKYDEVAGLCHPEFRFYPQLDQALSANEFVAQEKANMDSCPNFTMRIHEMFTKGNQVACYVIFEGVHTKPFHDLPPTGNTLRFSLMFKLVVEDGLIKEKRAHYDSRDVVRQLSA